MKRKREIELEAQKRRIQEYKTKKRQTEHLLANAEYIDFEDLANQTPELDADDILNSMQQQHLTTIKEKSFADNSGTPKTTNS